MENWWLDKDNFAENIRALPRTEKEWDLFFMNIAKLVSGLSKCSSRKVGAILVKDKDIVSMGFNGAPAGSNLCQSSGTCPRKKLGIPSGQRLDLCPAQHSESNCVNRAAKKGAATNESTLYCFCGIPCKSCAGTIINAGIKRVVCVETEKDYDDMAVNLLGTANVDIKKYKIDDIVSFYEKDIDFLEY
jgi:dCMP deaminase